MPSSTGPVAQTSPRGIELPIALDKGAGPLHEQIERALREMIRSGRLAAGMELPSTRSLAGALGISRGVITEAYGQLAAEGYLAARQGAPTRVALTMRAREPRPLARSLLPKLPYHFHPGLPDLAAFPRESWLRSVRAALRSQPLDAVGYGDPRGVPVLRDALASYLARVRGAAPDPEHMMITAGFTQGFSLTCRALAARGIERIAMEDPGWHLHRLVATQAGLEVVAIAVDGDGMDVAALATADPPAVLVTAAHHFPTGAPLSGERRAALIDWAEQRERLIVEDDFDAELRHDRVATGALQGLAPDRVLYIGSASKRLAPGLRLGWMLMPTWLTWELTAAKAIEDCGSETIGQLALSDFLARGELDRHVRRMRAHYASRRNALVQALARLLPEAQPDPHPAGLFALVMLPDHVNEGALLARAARDGVGAEGLGWHRLASSGPPGLLMGYASLSEPAIEHGVRLLADAYVETARG
jgi:GntR family transcriptional regulator/MocR family aminotransferase